LLETNDTVVGRLSAAPGKAWRHFPAGVQIRISPDLSRARCKVDAWIRR